MQSLRAFEAAARHLSMSLAAAELNLTHGAISRHVRALEDHLGVQLFTRLTRRIVLTEAGAAFHIAVVKVLSDLTTATEQVGRSDDGDRLSISTSLSFASKWLSSRLSDLKARYPHLDVHVDVSDANIDLAASSIDVAIRYGTGRYKNVAAERLLNETVTPVCSPQYKEHMGGLTTIESLAGCTLIHEERMLANWQQWFAMTKVSAKPVRRGPIFSHASMVIDAAIRGDGVALGRSALVADDLAAGRLVAPFPDHRLKAERGYDLVYRIGSSDDRKVRIVRDWLSDEIHD